MAWPESHDLIHGGSGCIAPAPRLTRCSPSKHARNDASSFTRMCGDPVGDFAPGAPARRAHPDRVPGRHRTPAPSLPGPRRTTSTNLMPLLACPLRRQKHPVRLYRLTHYTVRIRAAAVAELDGRPIAVTGSRDKTLRTWDLGNRRCMDELLIRGDGYDLALDSEGTLVAGFGLDIAIFDLDAITVPGVPRLSSRSRWRSWWRRISNR